MTHLCVTLFAVLSLVLPSQRHRPAAKPVAAATPCGSPFAFQVLLDRQGFSPGEIDGTLGVNMTRALTALKEARKLPSTGQPDCETWRALGGDSAGSASVAYTITADDVKGPFVRIPDDVYDQQKLDCLCYQSLRENFSTLAKRSCCSC